MEKQLDIVPFKPNMAKAFKELNLDWLEAFSQSNLMTLNSLIIAKNP